MQKLKKKIVGRTLREKHCDFSVFSDGVFKGERNVAQIASVA